jgi:hypothetical protein
MGVAEGREGEDERSDRRVERQGPPVSFGREKEEQRRERWANEGTRG